MPFQLDENGEALTCGCDKNLARSEFCGFCEVCWLALPEEQRAILRRDYVEQAEVIERVRTIYPAKRILGTVSLVVWRLLVTGLVGWLVAARLLER